MTGSTCEVEFPENPQSPSRLLSVWVLFWLTWGGLGASLLIALEGDWLGGTLWLAIGALIGLGIRTNLGVLQSSFSHTFDRVWLPPAVPRSPVDGESPWNRLTPYEPPTNAGLMVAPWLGLIHGILIGPFAGAILTWDGAPAAWLRAIEGFLIVWGSSTILAAAVAAVLAPRCLGPAKGPPRWMYLLSPLLLAPALWNCAQTLATLPKQRRVLGEFKKRGAIVWDGTSLPIFAILMDCSDEDIERLHPVADLYLAALSGNQITDVGVAHLNGLRRLENLSLASPGITDNSVENLSRLSHLRFLYLEGTNLTVRALDQLQKNLPRCQIMYQG